ncbi:hypothetical protein A9Q84_05000 [Halobacteriovorax marinus]|uniref:Fluoride-specific ion channel FluC n=1 Tax=Halobacteriovorax marinus TaxID=97084 RepID=A0A1Y5FH18_9BACT|nr:hypothetical protein A9Q84_05000 [Halobacteriovorax marinus]
MKFIPYVFLGGGIGATLRFLISMGVSNFTHRPWPGTLLVNILGCLFFFILHKNGVQSREVQSLLRVGLIGSLTTFSTFSFEVVTLIKAGRPLEAFTVWALNLLFGILLGLWILR